MSFWAWQYTTRRKLIGQHDWVFWPITDMLSGRRKHWNTPCVPVLIGLVEQASRLERPMDSTMQLLLAASWTAFRSDFSQGPFRPCLRLLNPEPTRKLLSVYLAHLIRICSLEGTWLDLRTLSERISEDQVWGVAIEILPSCQEQRKDLSTLDSSEVGQRLSQLYLALDSVTSLHIRESLVARPYDFLLVKHSHVYLLTNLAKSIAKELPRRLAEN